jgi:hypothetical protein
MCTSARAYTSQWVKSDLARTGPYLLALVNGLECAVQSNLGTKLLPRCQVGCAVANQAVIFLVHAGVPVLFPGLGTLLPASLLGDESKGSGNRKSRGVGSAKLSQMLVGMRRRRDLGIGRRSIWRRKRDEHDEMSVIG